MSSKNNKYSGKVTKEFVVGTKKPKAYKVGDSFTTGNETVFQSLILKNRIKP